MRLYLMPLSVSPEGHRGAKYIRTKRNPDGMDVIYHLSDYGKEPLALVAADVSDAQALELESHADVFAFPADLTQPLGADVDTIKAGLEALNIAADRLTAAHTYEQMYYLVQAQFRVMQRVNGLKLSRLFESRTLDAKLSDIPDSRKILDAATELGVSTEGATTLRELLREAVPSAADTKRRVR